MKLIIVRHGETEDNINEIVQGQTPGILSRNGKSQIKLLARKLKDEKIDVIFSSDLRRAVETAQEVARLHHGIPVECTPLLRERDFTVLEGKTIAEYRAMREKFNVPKHLFRAPGGENFIDMQDRARQFLDKISEDYKNKTVLVVSHGGLIKSLLGIVLDKPLEGMASLDIGNTSITILEMNDDSTFNLKVLCSLDHLDSA